MVVKNEGQALCVAVEMERRAIRVYERALMLATDEAVIAGIREILADEREQQVLRAHVHLAEAAGLLLREAHDLAGLVGELLEHAGSDASNPCVSAGPRACGPTDVGLLVRLYPDVRRL